MPRAAPPAPRVISRFRRQATMPDAPSPLILAASLIIPLVLTIVCHEMAHGLVARALGDDTAARMGRLSFNPLRHVDLVGTIILPGMLALMHAPVFGWAKPVPVDKWRLHRPRHDMMLVGAAGPASNFVLAAVAAVVLGLMVRFGGGFAGTPLGAFALLNIELFLELNLFIACFNLLPIPPFDGSHIVEGLLPERLAAGYARIRPYGMLVLMALIGGSLLVGHSLAEPLLLAPVEWLIGQYLQLAAWVGGTPHIAGLT